jgi:hypothetical protein
MVTIGSIIASDGLPIFHFLLNSSMRLSEILREYDIDYKRVPVKKAPTAGDRPDMKSLGQGYFSDVYAPAGAPHDVVKINYQVDVKDGYHAFVKALIDNERARDSIYFPRIRSVRELQTPGADFPYLLVRMEQLLPLQALTREELIGLATRHTDIPEKDIVDQYEIWDIIYLISKAINPRTHSPYKVTDTKLKNAIRWVEELGKKENSSVDLHSDNIMARRTPYGPQLVISDPLGLSA